MQKLRKDAEEARQSALAAQSEAERSREALNQRLSDLQRQAENDARLAEARAGSSRETAWLSPGSATTARAAW